MNTKAIKIRGLILVNVLVFGVIATIVTTAMINWAGSTLRETRYMADREQAFQIAESGIEYYRWHLAHFPTDYKDGTGTTTSNGPFIHEFRDKGGNLIGHFELTITPPINGSTIVKVLSRGTVINNSNIQRKIQVSMAIPSFAKYAVVTNDNMQFSAGTEVFGPIHSNNGIRFDGVAHNLITSSVDHFNDTTNPGGMVLGVYTTVSPEDPKYPATEIPERPDVFMAGRAFPVSNVDFDSITYDLSTLKTLANGDGVYLSSSGALGYHIVLKTDGTFDLYKVTSLEPAAKNCNNSQSDNGWGTWSIRTQVNPTTGVIDSPKVYTFPSNGIIFVQDNLWIDGQINNARLTFATGDFPYSASKSRNIIINKDLLYTNYDGRDSIGLVSQGNVSIGLKSEDNMRIDAAIISQNGRIGREYYSDKCGSEYIRDTLTLYGMIGTYDRYGFAYTDGTGYVHKNIIYDTNLFYAPPPNFPLTSSQYTTISWQEVP